MAGAALERESERGGSRPCRGVPEDWAPILDEVGSAYLPYLAANADAWNRGERKFDVEVQGVRYRKLPTSRYRVWCLEQLRAHHAALPDAPRAQARALLEAHDCWEPMWRVESRSGYDLDGRAPFNRGIVIYE